MYIVDLAESILSGNRRALARGITIVETGGAPARELLGALYARTGRAHIVGITGAPGVGKSTLVNALMEVGVDRVLFSVDTPWESADECCEWFDNCPINPNDRRKIAHGNAEGLFNLPAPK